MYENVQITDSTPFIATGKVEYASIFCKNDDYTVTPNTTWEASKRGVCLVTKVTAVVQTPSGNIEAKPYESSGTGYSLFAIIQIGANQFEVTRRTTGAQDQPPEDYAEPTVEQK